MIEKFDKNEWEEYKRKKNNFPKEIKEESNTKKQNEWLGYEVHGYPDWDPDFQNKGIPLNRKNMPEWTMDKRIEEIEKEIEEEIRIITRSSFKIKKKMKL